MPRAISCGRRPPLEKEATSVTFVGVTNKMIASWGDRVVRLYNSDTGSCRTQLQRSEPTFSIPRPSRPTAKPSSPAARTASCWSGTWKTPNRRRFASWNPHAARRENRRQVIKGDITDYKSVMSPFRVGRCRHEATVRSETRTQEWFLRDPRCRKWIVQCSACRMYGRNPDAPARAEVPIRGDVPCDGTRRRRRLQALSRRRSAARLPRLNNPAISAVAQNPAAPTRSLPFLRSQMKPQQVERLLGGARFPDRRMMGHRARSQ